jgi:hypothetical protein
MPYAQPLKIRLTRDTCATCARTIIRPTSASLRAPRSWLCHSCSHHLRGKEADGGRVGRDARRAAAALLAPSSRPGAVDLPHAIRSAGLTIPIRRPARQTKGGGSRPIGAAPRGRGRAMMPLRSNRPEPARRRNLFDTGAARCHLLAQVQQRKGGDPMSHVMVARLAPANETLVTSARIG